MNQLKGQSAVGALGFELAQGHRPVPVDIEMAEGLATFVPNLGYLNRLPGARRKPGWLVRS
jgi:hypothetical protein